MFLQNYYPEVTFELNCHGQCTATYYDLKESGGTVEMRGPWAVGCGLWAVD
jgi:hypothetical protein